LDRNDFAPNGLLALERDEDGNGLVDRDAAGSPLPGDAREHEHVLAEVDDLLSLEAIVLPGLEGVRPQPPHPLGALVDPIGIKRLQLEVGCKATSQKRFQRLRVVPRPRLADLPKPLDVPATSPRSIPPHR
jgi:hypothetical protein